MPRLPMKAMTSLRPTVPTAQSEGTVTQTLLLAFMIIAALYFGRDIFVPMALAVLLSFALSPLVSWLRRRSMPRTPAVIIVVSLAFLAIFAFGAVVAGQISTLGTNLPQYQSNIREKIVSLRANATGGGIIERASEMLRELSEEINSPAVVIPSTGTAAGPQEPIVEPIAVEIRQPDAAPFELLQNFVGPLVEPLATGGIVIVFVIFMLLQREDLRDRFIRLAGSSDLNRTTKALSDAGKRVAKYLLMQLIVNATYGIPVGVGLWLIGVPNPLLWGMLAILLRFVPYIGPFIAALFPLALAIAVDPGWTMLLWTAALFITLELVSNNIVEPWLYGSSTGLSPVAIIVAAIFWTWLWGPIGLLLSTPLTVCLIVLGRHVPQFGFLDILLGSEPVLTPHERMYQRLLAGDPDEATERAEEFLEKKPLMAFYQEVAIPAIAMVEQDRARGVLDTDRRAVVASGTLTLIDNLSEHEDVEAVEEEAGEDEAEDKAVYTPAEPFILAPEWGERPVLCVGGRGNLDDAAAAMVAHLLSRTGVGAHLVPYEDMAADNGAAVDLHGVKVICVSYMNAESLAHARFLVRRLRRRTNATIVLGFWMRDAEPASIEEWLKATRADLFVTSLPVAVEQILELAPRAAEPAPLPAQQAEEASSKDPWWNIGSLDPIMPAPS